MKLKRILSLALSGVLAVSMMTGCFGGGGKSDAINRSSTVASALNGAVSSVSFKTNDSKLNKAVSTITDSLTQAQAKVNGPVEDNSNIQATARQVTGYEDMNVNVKWNTQEQTGSKTFVRIFVFDATNSNYDSPEEITKAVSDKFTETMKLETATGNDSVTNEYKGYVCAYETEVGTEEEPASAWVIGVALTQTVKAK